MKACAAKKKMFATLEQRTCRVNMETGYTSKFAKNTQVKKHSFIFYITIKKQIYIDILNLSNSIFD